MTKRGAQHKRGQLFAVTSKTWYVFCATEGCEALALLVDTGLVHTRHEAQQYLKTHEPYDSSGWWASGGRWYCPTHKQKESLPCPTPGNE